MFKLFCEVEFWTEMFKESFTGVLRKTKGVQREFQGCFQKVSVVFQGCFNPVFHGGFTVEGVLRKFHCILKAVLIVLMNF